MATTKYSSVALRKTQEFDLMHEDSPWGKALARFKKQGMSSSEIDKQRQAYQKRMAMENITSLQSKSKKK